jgi:hypothetical protein
LFFNGEMKEGKGRKEGKGGKRKEEGTGRE